MKEATCRLIAAPLVKDVSSTFVTNLGALGLGLLSSILLNRSLGPEGRGLFATWMTTSQLVLILAGLGISKSATYFVANKEEDRNTVFHNLVCLTLGNVLLALLCLGVLKLFFGGQQAFTTESIIELG